MDSSRQRTDGEFSAEGSDGKGYSVWVRTDVTDASSWAGADATADGKVGLVTAAGQPVRRLGKGHYQIVGTDIVLRSDAPNAV